ncbi:MAG: IS630 family transposase [Actinomycetes bacterium]
MASPGGGVQLRDDEEATLRSWTRSSSVSAGEALRARIVLAAAGGEGTSEIARRLGVSRPTVITWRERYRSGGIDALSDAPRSGRPKTVDEAKILARTLEPPPKRLGVTHWSTRLLASELRCGDATVARCWRRFGLQPWRRETFKFSTDPELEAKVRDVIGLYLDPPEKAVVLCVDEKSQIQALDRTAPILPLRPGLPERATHDYVRHGTTTLFAALEVATGKVTDACYERHRHDEFLDFLKKVARAYPRRELHVVVDNYRTHKHPDVEAWLAQHPRVTLHFTPTSGSWLNLVEVFFSIITRQAIRRGTFQSVKDLVRAIRRFIDAWNDRCHPFVWTKTPDEVLRHAQNRQTTSDAGH